MSKEERVMQWTKIGLIAIGAVILLTKLNKIIELLSNLCYN